MRNNKALVVWLRAMAATAEAIAEKVESGKDWPGDVESSLAQIQAWMKSATGELTR